MPLLSLFWYERKKKYKLEVALMMCFCDLECLMAVSSQQMHSTSTCLAQHLRNTMSLSTVLILVAMMSTSIQFF